MHPWIFIIFFIETFQLCWDLEVVMWVYYNYEHFFCFGESNDSHETTWGPLLRSSDEEILSTLNHEKDRYQEAIFLGRHRTFQIGTSYVCIELPQKNMNGSKGILYLGQSLIHSLQGWWRGARFLLGPWRRQVFCR